MPNSIVKIPKALNEPVLNYSPGSPEKAEIKKALKEFKSSNFDIAMVIDGKKVTTDKQ
ncbi:MAG: 1-pyrroline-5-carboxylate dehydrogenase, partial [Saprospiraceae bacterium]|nr:1-pyrroline-5-carboxylate dehydrogenase [Saprospiraceae bacterium]